MDDGTFFYFPQSTFVAMGGSENVANGTSFEITQKDMKSSRCWEGNVTLFDTGDRNDGAEVFGRRQTDYKAGQWAARDMLQLKECGSKCSQASSGKFDIHCVSFICMTTFVLDSKRIRAYLNPSYETILFRKKCGDDDQFDSTGCFIADCSLKMSLGFNWSEETFNCCILHINI